MSEDLRMALELDGLAADAVHDLARRMQDIDNSYRAVAEKMGQLYMCADEHNVSALTRSLDKPMRNASENEQMFAAILEELQLRINRPHH